MQLHEGIKTTRNGNQVRKYIRHFVKYSKVILNKQTNKYCGVQFPKCKVKMYAIAQKIRKVEKELIYCKFNLYVRFYNIT